MGNLLTSRDIIPRIILTSQYSRLKRRGRGMVKDVKKHNPSKTYRIIALLLGGLLTCSLLTFGWLNHQEKQLMAQREDTVEFTGNIEADEVMASFKVPGKILQFMVDEGDEVKKGQVIAQLETDELKLKVSQAQAGIEAARAQLIKAENAVGLQSGVTSSQVEEARAAVERAQANLDVWTATWTRIQELYDHGAVSAQEKDKVEAEYKGAQGQLAQAQALLAKAESGQIQVSLSEDDVAAARAGLALAQARYDEAQVYLNNATLKAPMDGIVTLRPMETGETVGAGTPVLKITDLKNTFVKVYVPESKIGRVQLGQKCRVTTQSYPGKPFAGSVTWINPAGEFATQKAISDQYEQDIRSFEVKVNVPNADLHLKTGMTATVTFLAGD